MQVQPNSRVSPDSDRVEVSREDYELLVWLRRRWPTMLVTVDRLESCVDALERREPK